MTTRVCPECRGSGMRSCNGREFPCYDCSGEGSWEVGPEEGETQITLAELFAKHGSQLRRERKRRAA